MDEDFKVSLQSHGVFFSEAEDPVIFLEGNRVGIVIDPRYNEDNTFDYTSLLLISNNDPTENGVLVYAYGLLELLANEVELVAEAGKVRIQRIMDDVKKAEEEEIAKTNSTKKKKKPSKNKVNTDE